LNFGAKKGSDNRFESLLNPDITSVKWHLKAFRFEFSIIHNPRIWVGDSKQNEGRTNGQKQNGGSNSENPFWCQIREHMIGVEDKN